jgi:glycosyltransferase involved in cell wall biosynthesis
VRRLRPQGCVVFFSVPCGPLGLLFRVLARAPYVVSLRGGDVPGTDPSVDRMHRWLRWPRRVALRGAKAVVANSPGLAEFSRRADPVEVTVIPNGVDVDRFRPGPAPPPQPFRFLFVGRLIEQKKVNHLLEAIAQLVRSTQRSFSLTLVGDGPLRDAVKARATALGIDGVVEWIPWIERDQMPGMYRSAHCVVNASHCEGMPNVVLEAMACGVPVIVSDVPGNRDLVEHGRTGWIVPRDGLDELVAAMAHALREPEALRALGEAGCVTVRERYSWLGATRQYLEILGAASA